MPLDRVVAPTKATYSASSIFAGENAENLLVNVHVGKEVPMATSMVQTLVQKTLEEMGFNEIPATRVIEHLSVVEIFLLTSGHHILLSSTLHTPRSNGKDIFRLYEPRAVTARRHQSPAILEKEIESELAPALRRLLVGMLADLPDEPFIQEKTNESTPQ